MTDPLTPDALKRWRAAHAEVVHLLGAEAVRVACIGGGSGKLVSQYIATLIDAQPMLLDAAERGLESGRLAGAVRRLLATLDEHATGSFGEAEDACRELLK